MYNKLTLDDVAKLIEIVGKENVLVDEEISSDYAHDELGTVTRMPDVVVRVTTTEQVSKIMSLAWEKVIPVTVRGISPVYSLLITARC